MFPTFIDRFYHFLDRRTVGIFAAHRRKKITNLKFSIISNNCWGGVCYEHFGLLKQSPTVGMYFYPEDFLKLVCNLRHYLSLDMEIIDWRQSKNADFLIADESTGFLIGRIGDIEAVLVHYHSAKLAVEKWARRRKRVDFEHLYFKFGQENHATFDQLKRFDEAPLPGPKVMFVSKPIPSFGSAIYYKGFEKEGQILNDTFYWDRYFDIYEFLNKGTIKGRK